MAKLFPAFNEILNMKPDPTDGEKWLLKKLEKLLPDDYEVYFQASLEGSFPDIVIVRPNHGVVVIEVKDWDLSLYEINEEIDKNWTCHTSNHETCSPRSPFAQVKHYKNLFFGVYSRILASKKLYNKSLYGMIVPCVFFYYPTSKELNDLFSPHDDYFRKSYTYYFAKEDFDNGLFMAVLQNRYIAGDHKSIYFTDEIYNEFKRILRPSYHSLNKNMPVRWADDQLRYIASTPGKHKIRGVTGCGKTLVMAYRAVDAYKKTRKPVLILTFNITLCNYIHDCVSRFRGSIPWSNFIIKHYHRFIADYDNKYMFQEDGNNGKNSYKDNLPQKFKTILVDEAQDYEKEWIDDIHSYLEKGGELVFFGDEEQNIYGRGITYEGGKIRCYTKVDKKWGDLQSSFRVKGIVAHIAEEFHKTYLNHYDDNNIKPAMGDLYAGEGYYEYHYFNTCNDEELFQIFKRTLENKDLSNDDICILSTERNVVRKLDYLLRKRNYKTITNFETEEEYIQVVNMGCRTKKEIDEQLEDIRRTAKYCFWMESGKIKLVTVHSYKGWGINTGIFIIQDSEKLTPELIYTGITRVTYNLIVINIGSQKYDSFFRNVKELWQKNY